MRSNLAWSAAVILLAMSSARAQQAGTYKGVNNEGDEVEVVVASEGGTLEVTGMSDGGAVYCKGVQASTYGVAVGVSGVPITNGAATLQVYVIDLYYDSMLTFSGTTVKGTIGFSVPVYDKPKPPPKKACNAVTMPQTFTATLANSETKGLPAGSVRVGPIAR